MSLRIVRSGVFTSVQAGPRLGSRQFGVSSGGALDLVALRVLNALVANEAHAAVLEVVSGIVRLEFSDPRLIAWGGGEYEVRLGQTLLPAGHVAAVGEDQEISFAGPKEGFRAWLAISGGIDVPEILGSRSTDVRAHFGGWHGRPLQDGDVIPLGSHSSRGIALLKRLGNPAVANWSAPFEWTHSSASPSVLHFLPGKDWESFDQPSRSRFSSTTFTVTPESDRMGVRLRGEFLGRNDDGDLVSEGVAPGTIQVPPDGQPILLLGDCQTLGGYPKLAHVISVDLPRAAQLRPGEGVMFQEVSLADAHARLSQLERDLAKFAIGLEVAKR
jgi:antagonist of KipI